MWVYFCWLVVDVSSCLLMSVVCFCNVPASCVIYTVGLRVVVPIRLCLPGMLAGLYVFLRLVAILSPALVLSFLGLVFQCLFNLSLCLFPHADGGLVMAMSLGFGAKQDEAE